MKINHRESSLNAINQLGKTNAFLSKSTAKMASGLRINSASDDAAGLAMANKFRTQVNGAAQASRNTQDGISMLQTADGAMASQTDALQRMNELTVAAGNGALSADDRQALDDEYQALSGQVNQIAQTTTFNGQPLLSGAPTTVTFQTGANQGETTDFTTQATDSATLGLGGTNLLTQASAGAAQTAVSDAIGTVSAYRSELGAVSNQLQSTFNNLGQSQENQAAAESRIRDVDFAKESTKLSTLQIMLQSNTAMLGQSNMNHGRVLSLLS